VKQKRRWLVSFKEKLLETYEMALQSIMEEFVASLVNEPDMQCWLQKKVGHSYAFLVIQPDMLPFWLVLGITAQGLICSAQYASLKELSVLGFPEQSVHVGEEEISRGRVPQWIVSAVTAKPTK
jgi:hypothetical protein